MVYWHAVADKKDKNSRGKLGKEGKDLKLYFTCSPFLKMEVTCSSET
jgi:hypothetical protein